MPQESEYADDVDFLDLDPMRLKFILAVATQVLPEWSLNINASKTEFADFYLADQCGEDFEQEPWRTSILLGSQMCSSHDIKQRCILANVAFSNYRNVWLQGKTIALHRLVQVYEAMVVCYYV